MSTPANVAVLGTGKIGGTLGRAFARGGLPVAFGSRSGDVSIAADSGARVTTVTEALIGADVVVLAVPGPAVPDVVREHAGPLAGLLIVDATNRMGAGPAHNRDAVLEAVPSARYARAFNTLGVENFARPMFGDTAADMFYTAPEADEEVVEALISAVGLRPISLGEDAEDVLDGVLRLWFTLSQRRGRHLAFRVLDDA